MLVSHVGVEQCVAELDDRPIAFVQIAGMNPFEEQDPEDRGSYANSGVVARIVTIVAGPGANYLFAALLLSELHGQIINIDDPLGQELVSQFEDVV